MLPFITCPYLTDTAGMDLIIRGCSVGVFSPRVHKKCDGWNHLQHTRRAVALARGSFPAFVF